MAHDWLELSAVGVEGHFQRLRVMELVLELAAIVVLNMIEIESFQKAHLSKHTVDYLSAISFACMRTCNFIRFPNYLHQ